MGEVSRDDLDGPFAFSNQGFRELLTGIARIGEDVPEPGHAVTGVSEDEGRSVAILNVCRVNHGGDQCGHLQKPSLVRPICDSLYE